MSEQVERNREIITACFTIPHLTLAQVGERFGMGRDNVRRIRDRYRSRLYEEFRHLREADRYEEVINRDVESLGIEDVLGFRRFILGEKE